MLRRPLLSLLLVFSSLPTLAQNERHFTFHYAFTVKNVSPGERMRVWIPLAHSDAFQEVKVASKGGNLPLKQVQQLFGVLKLAYQGEGAIFLSIPAALKFDEK